ncbi:MAG: cytochrome P450, partial [Pseudomonadota bacterium]
MAAIAKRDWAAREAYIADPDTVRAVLRDGRFSPGGFTAYLDGLAARGMPLAHLQAMARHSFIFLSGRRHLALRRSVAPFLSAAAIAAQQPLLEAAVADALQRLAAAEDPDLVRDFVEPAFLKVVRAVIGLAGGEDVAVLDAVRIANGATEPLLPLGELRRIDKAMGTLSNHLSHGPPPAGSLLAGLAPQSAPLDPLGGPVNTALSALIAAYTMAQTLAFVLEGLLSGPLDAWADAAAPDWADRHLERNLSLYFATLTLARVSETAADVGGCPVAARRTVVLDMVRANEALRRRSPQAPAHLSFGAGVHKCPGEALARAFLATAVPRLAARYPRLTLQRDSVRHRLTSIVQFPDRLPAVLETVDRRLSRRLVAVRNPETARQIVNNDGVFAPPPMARHLEALQTARSDLNLSTALKIARNAPFLISGPRHAEIRRLVSSVL